MSGLKDEEKNRYTTAFDGEYGFDDLWRIVEILRSENGCPWDKVQTHQSIRPDLIEETYEVVEGIDRDDPVILREELGDLLLQVVFHAQIERERNVFDINDVCNDICKKLVYRHPHVFGDVKADNEDEALQSWNSRKRASKHQETVTGTVEGVCSALPANLRAEKVCKRAAVSGIPINNPADCTERIIRGLKKLETDTEGIKENIEHNQQIIGEILLNFYNLCRILKIDAEKGLTDATNRFIMNFRASEDKLIEKAGGLSNKEMWNGLSEEEKQRVADLVFSGLDSDGQ